ncbi:hypothetical protein WN944_023081 [Citrus x changshan-huyou]|uniref:Uncharacterized protein n=1 Tax=Citrus x changshan-huyou TaxID=2935761 RepID=A0AAP0R0W0_9ROSI
MLNQSENPVQLNWHKYLCVSMIVLCCTVLSLNDNIVFITPSGGALMSSFSIFNTTRPELGENLQEPNPSTFISALMLWFPSSAISSDSKKRFQVRQLGLVRLTENGF